MTHNLNDHDIDTIAAGLIDRTLPKAQWTHAAHWAAALWLLRSAAHDAERDMPVYIRAYNQATGTENTDSSGYHETITRASLVIAQRCLDEAEPDTPLSRVLSHLLAGRYSRSDWLLSHWSKARLFSVDARHNWLAPDLKPL